jgi:hypothetical protein
VITADPLRAVSVTVTGVDIDELDPALTTGPQHTDATSRRRPRGSSSPRRARLSSGQMPVRIGYALAMAAPPARPSG